MIQLLTKYKSLKAQLVGDPGCEETMDEVMWNDGVISSMNDLLKDVSPDIAQMIRLGHI